MAVPHDIVSVVATGYSRLSLSLDECEAAKVPADCLTCLQSSGCHCLGAISFMNGA